MNLTKIQKAVEQLQYEKIEKESNQAWQEAERQLKIWRRL